jgi:hypothetical protein
MVLVQGAQHILGPFGEDSDLRRWGLKLAEHGGKSWKKSAIIAVARKLAAASFRQWLECTTSIRRVPATAPLALPPLHQKMEREGTQQTAAPTVPRTPNVHRAHESPTKSADGRVTSA